MSFDFGPAKTSRIFTQDNPVVPKGDIWVEWDTGYTKRGDGGRAWADLPYWNPHPPAHLAVTDFGAKGDGVTDDKAAIQKAINKAVREGGGIVHLPLGTYLLGSAIQLGDNVWLQMAAGAVIKRGFGSAVPVPQTNKYTGALIRQQTTDAGSPNRNIRITGGRVESNGFDGPVIAMYFCEDLVLSDIDIDYTGAGDWCVTVSGTRINISNVNPRGGAVVFEDGIHVLDCDGVVVTGCHIESGDDMVAVTSDTGAVRHVAVNGITGSSQEGFLFKLALASGASSVTEYVSFTNASAKPGVGRNGGIQFVNASGDRQKMRHVTVSGVTLDTGNTATVNPRGIYVDAGYDITFQGCTVNEFLWEQLYVDDCDLLRLVGCTFNGAASSTFPIARILDSGIVSIDGSTLKVGSSGTGAGIRFSNVTNGAVRGCDFLAVPANGQAVFFESSSATGVVENCRATPAAGACHGVRIDTTGLSRLIYSGNDFEPLAGHEIYPENLPATMRISRGDGAPTAVTIASGILTSTARMIQVEGEAGAADELATIRLISGLSGSLGQEIMLFRGGEDITVKHGTGNIKTASAADVVMTATANTVLHFAYDGTNWVQV